MKALIWFVVLLVPSVITVALQEKGIGLGAIPTVLLYSLCFFAAKTLCARWEVYDIERKASQSGVTPFEYVKSQTPKVIIDHLESEKNSPEELRAFLDNYVKAGSMKKVYADILVEGYTK